jgi:hypothetical protein
MAGRAHGQHLLSQLLLTDIAGMLAKMKGGFPSPSPIDQEHVNYQDSRKYDGNRPPLSTSQGEVDRQKNQHPGRHMKGKL